jgi:hypothetical protein
MILDGHVYHIPSIIHTVQTQVMLVIWDFNMEMYQREELRGKLVDVFGWVRG